jgi:hypothetical protein
MNHEEAIKALTAYHSMPKIKNGIEYVVAPPPTPAPTPVAEDRVSKGLQQTANAFFELSRIYKNLGD